MINTPRLLLPVTPLPLGISGGIGMPTMIGAPGNAFALVTGNTVGHLLYAARTVAIRGPWLPAFMSSSPGHSGDNAPAVGTHELRWHHYFADLRARAEVKQARRVATRTRKSLIKEEPVISKATLRETRAAQRAAAAVERGEAAIAAWLKDHPGQLMPLADFQRAVVNPRKAGIRASSIKQEFAMLVAFLHDHIATPGVRELRERFDAALAMTDRGLRPKTTRGKGKSSDEERHARAIRTATDAVERGEGVAAEWTANHPGKVMSRRDFQAPVMQSNHAKTSHSIHTQFGQLVLFLRSHFPAAWAQTLFDRLNAAMFSATGAPIGKQGPIKKPSP